MTSAPVCQCHRGGGNAGSGRKGGTAPQEKGLTVKAHGEQNPDPLAKRDSEGSGDQGFYFVLLCPHGGFSTA